ncbi:MAG TPA: site-2 protease family protein [Blastocatellia bacterium]|nr:site-2 protease family protein [Blastocatellia bacterium]
MSIVNILLGPVWLVFLIVFHESSHAIAGKILGFRVFWISIGYGRPLVDARLLGIRLKLNIIPFNGETALASPYFQGTRGAVLVCLGRVDEGIGMLRKAYSRHRDLHSRACNAYWIGIAEARRGNHAKGTEWIRTANTIYPNHEMAEVAIAEVEAARVELPSVLNG